MKQDVTLPMLWAIALPMLNSPESPSNSELARGKGKAPGLGLLKPRSPGQALELPPMLASDWSRIHLAAF